MRRIWSVVEEAMSLEAHFARLKLEQGISQAKFAETFKVPGGASMLSQHIKARRPMNLEAALVYSRGLQVPLEEISPRLAQVANQAANAVVNGPPMDKEVVGDGLGVDVLRRQPAAPATTPAPPAADWPFAFDRARWDALNERQKGVVEDAALQAIEKIEARADADKDREAA